MRPVRTTLLLAGLLLAPTGTSAAPWGHPWPRLSLDVRTALHTRFERRPSAEHVLRELPTASELPGAYLRLSRWVEDFTRPRRDGTMKLVVVTVPGGLGLGWARRW